MRAGAMRKRITLQRRSVSIDGSGGQVDSWSMIGEVWADIQPSSGNEQGIGDAVRDVLTHVISIRYFKPDNGPPLGPKDRIVFGDRFFNIVAVVNVDERNREMQLNAQEGLASG